MAPIWLIMSCVAPLLKRLSGPPVDVAVVVESHGHTVGYPTTALPSKATSPNSSAPPTVAAPLNFCANPWAKLLRVGFHGAHGAGTVEYHDHPGVFAGGRGSGGYGVVRGAQDSPESRGNLNRGRHRDCLHDARRVDRGVGQVVGSEEPDHVRPEVRLKKLAGDLLQIRVGAEQTARSERGAIHGGLELRLDNAGHAALDRQSRQRQYKQGQRQGEVNQNRPAAAVFIAMPGKSCSSFRSASKQVEEYLTGPANGGMLNPLLAASATYTT